MSSTCEVRQFQDPLQWFFHHYVLRCYPIEDQDTTIDTFIYAVHAQGIVTLVYYHIHVTVITL